MIALKFFIESALPPTSRALCTGSSDEYTKLDPADKQRDVA